MTHHAFFGDAERAFTLTTPLILELERKTGAGIGTLAKRVTAGEFRFTDVVETVRLALIGGGTAPEEAAALVQTYTAARPIAETYGLAVEILQASWFGSAATVEQAIVVEQELMRAALTGDAIRATDITADSITAEATP